MQIHSFSLLLFFDCVQQNCMSFVEKQCGIRTGHVLRGGNRGGEFLVVIAACTEESGDGGRCAVIGGCALLVHEYLFLLVILSDDIVLSTAPKSSTDVETEVVKE